MLIFLMKGIIVLFSVIEMIVFTFNDNNEKFIFQDVKYKLIFGFLSRCLKENNIY